jgi:hypothetical protein
MTETGQVGCMYLLLENGVHQFTFTNANKPAIDEFFRHVEHILAATPPETVGRHLIDVSQNSGESAISLAGGVQRFRRLETQLPHRAPGRTVILHKPGVIYGFVDSLIRVLAPKKDVTRFFPVEERDAAMEWLLKDK